MLSNIWLKTIKHLGVRYVIAKGLFMFDFMVVFIPSKYSWLIGYLKLTLCLVIIYVLFIFHPNRNNESIYFNGLSTLYDHIPIQVILRHIPIFHYSLFNIH